MIFPTPVDEVRRGGSRDERGEEAVIKLKSYALLTAEEEQFGGICRHERFWLWRGTSKESGITGNPGGTGYSYLLTNSSRYQGVLHEAGKRFDSPGELRMGRPKEKTAKKGGCVMGGETCHHKGYFYSYGCWFLYRQLDSKGALDVFDGGVKGRRRGLGKRKSE